MREGLLKHTMYAYMCLFCHPSILPGMEPKLNRDVAIFSYKHVSYQGLLPNLLTNTSRHYGYERNWYGLRFCSRTKCHLL